MSSIGDLFGIPGGDTNDTPFDPSVLDSTLDQIMATRPPAGAPEGYVRPGTQPPAATPDGGPPAAVGGDPATPASVPPETPAPLPAPGLWPPGPASPWPGADPAGFTPPPPAAPPAAPPPPAAVTPPAAPLPPPADPLAGTPFEGASALELQELALIRQSLRDPERAGGIRQAYIGGVPTPPPAAPPAATTPPPAAPAGFTPKPMPEEIVPGSHEAEMWDMAQEHERQLAEIRQGIQERNERTEVDNRRAAAMSAVTEFRAKYGHALSDSDIQWIAQTAGYTNLPEAFDNADLGAGRTVDFKANMTKALEFQLRSTDVLLNKILGGGAPQPAPATAAPGVPAPPPVPPGYAPPVLQPGDTPAADARKRHLTAVSSPASPSGDTPTRIPIQHRADGKIEEKSRFALIQELTGGGALQELMGPGQ